LTAHVLAGDVGGTKTTLGLFEAKKGIDGVLTETTFSSRDFPTFEAVVREFLKDGAASIECACFGVAGPVVGGEAKVTNLPWSVDERKISSELGVPSVRVINDLQATASAIPYLPQEGNDDCGHSARHWAGRGLPDLGRAPRRLQRPRLRGRPR